MKRDTSIARNVWIKHHKYIPKDVNNRSYEIHHIDGNHKNNNITNLLAIPINMHYEIHYLQQDYSACNLIAERIEKPSIKGYKRKPLSEETKNKIRLSKTGKKYSEEINRKKGKKRIKSEEEIEKLKKSLTGKPLTDQHKKSISSALTGKKISNDALEKRKKSIWITDGIKNKRIYMDTIIPNGWFKGRGKLVSEKIKNTKNK
jgi:hypothetical protein